MKVINSKGTEIELQEIQDTGWIVLSDICKYRVLNSFVFIQIYNTGLVKLKGSVTLGTLPIQYRPSAEMMIPIQFMGGVDPAMNPLIHSRVETNGKIVLYFPYETSYVSGFAIYPI